MAQPYPEDSASRTTILSRLRSWVLSPLFWLLFLPALIIIDGMGHSEFYFYGDEMRHAMNGVFFRDLLVDLPFRNPMQYALEYYAKYPALAIAHWPPFFHLVEGLFFLIFGISTWASRLSVLGFTLCGLFFWYRIAERFGSTYRALLSGLIFALMPHILIYERSAMLEIPSIATCLGTIYFWLRLMDKERPADLWAVVAFSVLSFLTSQKAIFLVFFFAGHLIMERRFRLLRRWDVWVALITTAAFVLPWYILTFQTLTPMTFRAFDPSFEHLFEQGQNLVYLRALPRQMGIPLLCLSGAGIAWALLTQRSRFRFFLLWILSCYACFTLIPEKDARHTMIWFPPLVYFALLAVETLFLQRKLALVAQSMLALFFFAGAARTERPFVRGAEDAARYTLSLPESEIIFYRGDLDGNFIFFARKHDPEKRHMVARDKQILVTKIVYDARPILRTKEEVLDFFRTWGIRYALAESSRTPKGLEPVAEALRSDQFELIRSFPLETNVPRFTGRQIRVYRFRGEQRRSSESVVIPMMTIRDNIQVDLSRLAGRPWPD